MHAQPPPHTHTHAGHTVTPGDVVPAAAVLLQRNGVSGYILDLRDNPGGLVKAGLDIARLLLDGHPTVFSIVGRSDEGEQKVGRGDVVGNMLDLSPAVIGGVQGFRRAVVPH